MVYLKFAGRVDLKYPHHKEGRKDGKEEKTAGRKEEGRKGGEEILLCEGMAMLISLTVVIFCNAHAHQNIRLYTLSI